MNKNQNKWVTTQSTHTEEKATFNAAIHDMKEAGCSPRFLSMEGTLKLRKAGLKIIMNVDKHVAGKLPSLSNYDRVKIPQIRLGVA